MRATSGRYVALGSSFGAGPGLRPRVAGSPRSAGRSASNAAHLFALRAGVPLVDVTYSGATVAQLRSGGPGQGEPQLAAVDKWTTLVTITAGGNDVGYLPALTLSSVARPLRSVLFGRRIAELTDPAETERRFARLGSELRSLVGDIAVVAPAARIAVIGYLTILPPAGIEHPPLPQPVAEWGRDVARRLAETQAAAAADTGVAFIDVPTASSEHHAWSAVPWTRGFHYGLRGGAPYHPNAAGMQTVARLMGERLDALE